MKNERERLIELLNRHCALRQEYNDCTNETTEDCSTCLADFLLKNGVIVPPCKVGDMVFRVDRSSREQIKSLKVVEIWYSEDGFAFIVDNAKRTLLLEQEKVFLTKEEAEAALKGGAE